MSAVPDVHARRKAFFQRSAKAWQNWFDLTGLLRGIRLSEEQLAVVEQDEDQLLIHGSAGSGKSIALMYKLVKTMKQEQEPRRILYVTFNKTLIDDTRKRLAASDEFPELAKRHHLDLYTFHYMAYELLKRIGLMHVEPESTALDALKRMEDRLYRRISAIEAEFRSSREYQNLPQEERLYSTHTARFLAEEIMWMKGNGFIDRETYLEVERAGRSQNPRLTKQQRKTVWRIFEIYQDWMKNKFHNDLDLEDYALLLLQYMDQIPDDLKYDFIFVDEMQDLQPMQIKALVQLAKRSIVLTGDPKQRIYQSSPHTYASLGLNIQGRKSRHLRKNFRSTKQIMALASGIKFQDEENDRLDHLIYVREGKVPVIRYCGQTEVDMGQYLVRRIREIQHKDPSASIAVIHRYDEELNRGVDPLLKRFLQNNVPLITVHQYNKRFDPNSPKKPVFFTDVFSSKGLEFDYVFITHFDRDHYPHKKRIEELQKRCEDQNSAAYNQDYDRIMSDEKKLLYVAITRARKEVELLYTGKTEMRISPFVRDFYEEDYEAVGFEKRKYVERRRMERS